jgi:apolipoprotein D and lipocalin family protein
MNYYDEHRDNKTGRGYAPKFAVLAMVALLTSACSSRSPLETVEYVDLERFMGDWYVIANIPTSIEKEAYNAVETYRMNPDGTIATTFTFRKGGFDGKEKRYEPKGFIRDDGSNAEWGMQFIWPIKADYRIIYLDEDYQLTVIGRNKRDYVWVMARDWSIPDERYRAMQSLIESVGYDVSELRKVPQKW